MASVQTYTQVYAVVTSKDSRDYKLSLHQLWVTVKWLSEHLLTIRSELQR